MEREGERGGERGRGRGRESGGRDLISLKCTYLWFIFIFEDSNANKKEGGK